MAKARQYPDFPTCYDHPTHDGLPFIPECQLIFEDGPDPKSLFKMCEKNPGHSSFIPIKDFNIQHLPPEQQTDKMMETIKHHSNMTVKVITKNTSLNRPDTYPNSMDRYPYSEYKGSDRVVRVGTGVIDEQYIYPFVKLGRCPCALCKTSGEPKKEYYFFGVVTAAHIVFDEFEAEDAVCELFYDSEERDNVKCLHGVGVLDAPKWINIEDSLTRKCKIDHIIIRCVTHDKELAESVRDLLALSKYIGVQKSHSPLHFIISHPHGYSKHITIGKVLQCVFLKPSNSNPNYPSDTSYSIPQNTKCRLCSTSTELSNKSFQRLVDSDIPCKLGVEYRLIERISLTLPSDAKYFCETSLCNNNDKLEGIIRSSKSWVKFPSKTRFECGDRVESPDMEFQMNTRQIKFRDYFFSYDAQTCPGSSGAGFWIIDSRLLTFHQLMNHIGVRSGMNVSGQT